MEKKKILDEYFLIETEKTCDIKGWKILGRFEEAYYQSQSLYPIIELKSGDGWLCDFRIKLLYCGLVLVSPEYVVDEDELVMEAMEKLWNEGKNELQKLLELQKSTITSIPEAPYWTSTTTTAPAEWTYCNDTITCSNTITCGDSSSVYRIEKLIGNATT